MNDDCRVTLVSPTLRLRLQTVRQVDNAEIFRFTKFEVHCILPDDQRLRRLPPDKARSINIPFESDGDDDHDDDHDYERIKTTTITPPGDATIIATTTSWRGMEALPPPSDDDHG